MKDTIVIAELKHDREAPLERLLSEAEAQINDKNYYERYVVEGKRIILLAVAFSGKEAGSRIIENVGAGLAPAQLRIEN
jgi:hypothetical protein